MKISLLRVINFKYFIKTDLPQSLKTVYYRDTSVIGEWSATKV